MIHTKTIKRNVQIFLVLVAMLAAGAFSISANTPVSAALTPGCYVTGSGSYEKVNCPDADLSRAVTQFSKCFVATGSSQGVSSFREQDCSTLNNSSSSGGTGGTGGSGGTSGSGNEFVENSEPIQLPDETPPSTGTDGRQCGKGSKKVVIGFNIGCKGDSYPGEQLNPIVDMLFALFRFLSVGVGIVVIGSIIVAGIQYAMSRGNPQATQAAIKRIASSVGALILYIFIFAIANYLIPGGIF